MPEPAVTPDGVRFTSNYTDKSNQMGFQFEFRCDRCRSVFRTPYKPSVVGGMAEGMRVAGSLLGGFFGRMAGAGERVRGVAWKSARDAALKEAVAHVLPEFIQCPKCQLWVCRKACWNLSRGLCKKCAPDVAVAAAAAAAMKEVKDALAAGKKLTPYGAPADAGEVDSVPATCPKCDAPVPANAKFCTACGAELNRERKCGQCGAALPPGAKFCGACGTPAAD